MILVSLFLFSILFIYSIFCDIIEVVFYIIPIKIFNKEIVGYYSKGVGYITYGAVYYFGLFVDKLLDINSKKQYPVPYPNRWSEYSSYAINRVKHSKCNLKYCIWRTFLVTNIVVYALGLKRDLCPSIGVTYMSKNKERFISLLWWMFN